MTGLVGPGSVGMPDYTGMEANPVPDPSPGSFSVLYDGTWGPTPPDDERREHWGLPPVPLTAQVTPATGRTAAPAAAASRAAPTTAPRSVTPREPVAPRATVPPETPAPRRP